jgi:RimJ/RimL family protein N-acetyltransferase
LERIAETERLWLREFNPGDAKSFYLLNLDPEVIKYTGDDSFINIEEAEKFLLNYDHCRKHGFGRWAVMRKTDNTFLGWCGLKYIEDIDEYDIGFRFFKKYWGYGYATESAKAG